MGDLGIFQDNKLIQLYPIAFQDIGKMDEVGEVAIDVERCQVVAAVPYRKTKT
jgi:hypothetical protein